MKVMLINRECVLCFNHWNAGRCEQHLQSSASRLCSIEEALIRWLLFKISPNQVYSLVFTSHVHLCLTCSNN